MILHLRGSDAGANAAVEWAAKQGVVGLVPISTAPWSDVYRGHDAAGLPLILKRTVRPRPEAGALSRVLSDRFAPFCPRVIAAEPAIGATLYEDLAQDMLGAAEFRAPRVLLLAAYADFQARGAAVPGLLPSLPRGSARAVLDQVRELAEGRAPSAPGNAFAFMGAAARDSARGTLESLAGTLETMAAEIDEAPPVLNHTDLRSANVHLRSSGQICLFDWDDAIVSAPGWSLHNAFSGATRVFAALRRPDLYREPGALDRDAAALEAYMAPLLRHGAYGRSELEAILPGTAIFGVLKYIADMAPYALADAAAHEVVRRMVEARIKGLARIAEVLPSGRQPSGRRGLEPEAPAPAGPTRASAPAGPMAARFPEFDATEAKGQGPAAASLARARLFARDGALLLRRCVPEEAIAAVAAEVAAARDAHRAEMDSGAALRVGPKRFMVTLDTAGAAGGPDVMAPPELMEVLDRLLGKDFVLASVTAVISLPGAPEQKWHRDTRLLFPERTENASPCYSIAALFPLVPLTAAVGATEILPGSHRETNRPTESFPVLRPEAGPGDCYLMDGRLIHRGMSNHSSADRPILSIVYQRPWFRDDLNFSAQPPLHRAPGLAIRLPPERRHLLAWTETG